MNLESLKNLDQNLQEIIKQNLGSIIEKNIGPITGNYVLIYDTESTLSRILKEGYEAVIPKPFKSIDFGTVGSDFKSELITLPKDSLVILVQSTNFRITDFRIRLELFQYGIHCIEHNHLGYYPDGQAETYIHSLAYRTPEYSNATRLLQQVAKGTNQNLIISPTGEKLVFGELEAIRGNTGDYSEVEVKGGTFPIGEAFTEAVDLTSVNGTCRIFGYPNDSFQVVFCDPFTVEIQNGLLLDNPEHPEDFRKLMNRVRSEENNEALVRELGIGYNPAISLDHRLSDVNGHERHLGVHLSIGKKHGIFTKKFPKGVLQKFHIDIFLEVAYMEFGDARVDFDKGKILVESTEK